MAVPDDAIGPAEEPAHRLPPEVPEGVRRRLQTLLSEARYGSFIAMAEALGPLDMELAERRDTLVGHARLALAHDLKTEAAIARDRENSSRWLTTQLLEHLRQVVRERRPCAFIRLGDGEARFTVTMQEELRPTLSRSEALALSRPVWTIRQHERIDGVEPLVLAELFDDYRRAVQAADILGVSDAERLSTKPNIFGFLAAQENWLRRLLAGRGDVLFTDALAHHRLDERSPFFADLLAGLDFLGVIGPHPDLAGRMAARFGIPATLTFAVPGENVLPDAKVAHAAGRHFPERYREILKTVEVPKPGAVFLVAAGLLGKIYCARIKTLGGIALDIGSVADTWMGMDTRPGYRTKPANSLSPSD